MDMHLFRILLLLLVSLAWSVGAQASSRIALVIGNAAYEEVPSLRNSANDARLMTATLEGLGFEVDMRIDADRRDMARAIRDFGARLTAAGASSIGLFFYAGHGVQAHGTNYLLPLKSDVIAEADLQIEAIDANWVLGQMEEAGNTLNIIILDACRNNPYSGSIRGSERGLARISALAGSLVAYSAAPGQVALDGDGANSPYTAALTEAMQRPGMELVRVFRETRLAVEDATGGLQTPWEEQSLRSDFYFVPGETDVAAISPEPDPDATPPSSPDAQPDPGRGSGDVELELTFWNTVKDSTNPAELQAYIEAFPDGLFVSLAELRIARLEAGLEVEEEPVDEEPPSAPEPSEGLSKGYLGVRSQAVTQALAAQVGLQNPWGEFVTGVVPGSPAELAGILIGDVIVGFDDVVINEEQSFSVFADTTAPGQEVEVHVVRNGSRLTLRATLVSREQIRGLVQAERDANQQREASTGDPATDATDADDQQVQQWFLIAEKYYYGRGAPQSYENAITWYRRAAEHNHVEAIYSLGWMYSAGQGVEQDYAEAARWHRRAADLGHAGAQGELGYLYDTGRGVRQDDAQALQLYRLAADGGNARAMGNLAVMLDAGRGTSPDPYGAATYLLRSFAAGDQITQTWLFGNPGKWTAKTRFALQRQLSAGGFYTGTIDGDIGPGTRRALEAYRAASG